MNYLTRGEATKTVGVEVVDMVDGMNCVNSERVLENPDIVEFIAIIDLTNSKYDTLTAFYYQDWTDVKHCEDLGNLEWEVYGYKLN